MAEQQGLSAERVNCNLALHRASASGNVDQCELLLSVTNPGKDWDGSADVWYADDEMIGWDALHYAADAGHVDVVRLLLKHGAIWNAVDHLGYTAADVAWSRNHVKCYEVLFQEGERQSFLVDLLSRRVHQDQEQESNEVEDNAVHTKEGEQEQLTLVSGSHNEVTYSNTDFLQSRLTFVKDERGQWRCLDKDKNMVMAEWENEIMLASARALCEGQPEGFSILNVGFGLGIIDEAIQSYKPGRHVIIEPHPDVIAFMEERGWHERPGVEIFKGTWEQFMKPENDDDGSIAMALGDFDAIYFDTYSQDYQDLRLFFECLPNVLSGPEARFSFFHGLAATNQFLYNVYTRVSELDLKDIGLSTKWSTLSLQLDEETWDGVKRKYWTLPQYYLPVSHMDVL
ncbi:Arginine N-methyltransferase 2 [Malassezia pachydermatis]|uniref:Arginine N-methyltransferase 2 n=1 Tax=Malassezia pachydermatis TaxID=77020 RepID=A0A0M9VR71_9BASI|nr:rmt2-protein-arginine n-methyltransferase [Malassezia pachydermatis]KOS16313.1 rmt2-protein-arginine n-methyltransferase [Malassezia pachydermatis]